MENIAFILVLIFIVLSVLILIRLKKLEQKIKELQGRFDRKQQIDETNLESIDHVLTQLAKKK